MRTPCPSFPLGTAAVLFSLSLSLAALIVAAPASAGEAVGHVYRLDGNAVAEGQNVTRPMAEASPETVRRTLTDGGEIYEGDVITTAPHASLELKMIDGTKVVLGSDSALRVDAYVYKPNEKIGGGTLSIVRGTFRVVTGGLAKLPGEPIHVKTTTVALGIRGTDIWGEQNGDQSFIAMLNGKGVTVTDAAGTREITNSNFAIWVGDPDRRPPQPYALTWMERRSTLIQGQTHLDLISRAPP